MSAAKRTGQVAVLSERVAAEQGRLDLLVNYACAIPDELTQPGPFWRKPLHMLDLLDVGMRSHYVAIWHAARLMVAQRSGLIVHTSSHGSVCCMHGQAYGAGRAAVDKMAHDMAFDLRPYSVAVVSLWMGLLRTERTALALQATELLSRGGDVCIAAELALALGVRDIDASQPPSNRHKLGAPPRFSLSVVG